MGITVRPAACPETESGRLGIRFGMLLALRALCHKAKVRKILRAGLDHRDERRMAILGRLPLMGSPAADDQLVNHTFTGGRAERDASGADGDGGPWA
jgi:hypothetical protein